MNLDASLLKQGAACGQEGVPVAPPPLLLNLLETSHHILCISHVSPDGDAVGSLLGLGGILRAMGKRPVLALQDELAPEYQFLPGVQTIIGPAEVAHSYDLIVCLDTSSIDRMGSAYCPEFHDRIPLIVIDHHITNTFFGTENWVDAESAATCQMLVRLADRLDVPLTEEIAVALLTGLRDERVDRIVSFFGPTDFFDDWVREIVREAALRTPRRLTGVAHLDSTVVQPYILGDITRPEARLELVRRSPVLFAADLPRLQVHHGTIDLIVPVSQAESLIRAMEAIGRGPPDFEAYIYDSAGHDLLSLEEAFPRAAAFLSGGS